MYLSALLMHLLVLLAKSSFLVVMDTVAMVGISFSERVARVPHRGATFKFKVV
jgi:hypothetical protein